MSAMNKYGQAIHPPEVNANKYLSNHVLVNRVRLQKNLPKLRRSQRLDSLAQYFATQAAKCQDFAGSQHSVEELKALLGSERVGLNLCRGKTMIEMHTITMAVGGLPRDNILSKDFVEMGMATARADNGKLYMVQFFRGPTIDRLP